MFKKIISFVILILLISGGFFFLFPHQGWNNYYQKKLYLPPADMTKKAVNFFSHSGVAIDFGCGCGNDSAFLLQNGWTVWAIDGEPLAIEILKKRKDISEQSLLLSNDMKNDPLGDHLE